MRKIFRTTLTALALLASTGCMKATSAITESAQKAADGLGCPNMKSKLFDSMYDYLDQQDAAPPLETFTEVLNEKVDQIAADQHISDQAEITNLKNNLASLYKTLIEQSVELKQTKTAKEHLQTLIELEMHDVSTAANVKLNSMVATQYSKVAESVAVLDFQCSNSVPSDTSSGSSSDSTNSGGSDSSSGGSNSSDQSNSNGSGSGSSDSSTSTPIGGGDLPPAINLPTQKSTPMIIGAHNVFAIAYQSCQTLELPEVNASTASVEGISITGKHSDGVGSKRQIASLSSVQKTHPYIKVSGKTSSSSCFNVYSNPLIYDYGGSPAVSNNVLNFFKDAGSGTNVLGVDCSAYVSSAVAAAGLKYRPDTENKAIYTRQTSSKFVNATKSGFTCFENVTMTPTSWIKPGDIMGISGHVVVVDRVGSDPFGFLKYKSESDCSKITVSQFDFSISQSSPSKGGLGLNRFVAKDYLASGGTMQTGFLSFAKAACKAYFGNKNVATESSSYGLLRHKGTAECMSTRVALTNQSCVQSCLE